MRLLVEVDDGESHLDGAVAFDDLLSAHEPQPRKQRAGEDLYMLYTGGTTGMPKGVMYAQGEFTERLLGAFALLGLDVPTSLDTVGDFVRAVAARGAEVSLPCCPLMHGTGMWVSAMPALLSGSTIVLLESRTFDPHEVWRLTSRERVTRLVFVGDPFARPLLRALEEQEATAAPYDVSSIRMVVSAGAIWSAEIKDGLRSRLSAILVDALGSTEGGTYALSTADHQHGSPTAQFMLSPDTRVVTEDGREVVRGSGERGLLASRTAALGYFKDAEKTARTFVRLDGESFVITGDWATVDLDGAITLLGRGSNCINSGGEKIFPRRSKRPSSAIPSSMTAWSSGCPTSASGSACVAVVGSTSTPPPTADEIRAFLRASLSHFKIPKDVVVRDAVQRAPNGKADYQWALATASA